MAALTFWPARSRTRDLVAVCGSFAPNGNGTVDNTQNQGRGFTASYASSAGAYTITLEKPYSRLVSCQVTIQSNGFADRTIMLTAANDTTGVYTFTSALAGVATDIAANANNRIHFCLFLQNSGVK